MPCWTVQENGLDLKNPDPETLISSLMALGFSGNLTTEAFHKGTLRADCFDGACAYCSVTMKDGQLTLHRSGSSRITMEQLTSHVKQAYSRGIVQTAAKKFGWSVKQIDETHLQVARRA